MPLLALTAGLSSPVLAEVDKKTAEFCMKAADFAGCVQTMQGGSTNSNQKQKLIDEIKKLPTRIANSSLRDFTLETRSFVDALALSNEEDIGSELYQNAKKLEASLDILQATWDRKITIDVYGYHWGAEKNRETGANLDQLFGGKTIDIRCNKAFFGKQGENIFFKVRSLISQIADEIASTGGTYTISQDKYLIPSSSDVFCSGDPRAPKKPSKLPMACRNGTWDKNHPKCQLPENKITSPMDMD